jgi:hypothetical protein
LCAALLVNFIFCVSELSAQVSTGSPVTVGPTSNNLIVFNGPIAVELVDNSGDSFGSFALDSGQSIDVQFMTTPTGEYVVMLRVTVGTATVTMAGQPHVLTAGQVFFFFSAPKTSQTISFARLANKTFGDADFTVSAQASSGLMVDFTASGDCTVSGSTVHLTGVGSCTITASQDGDSNNNPATPVSQTFTISAGAGFTSKAIPELVAGKAGNVDYVTTIEVVNSGSTTVTLSGSFYTEDGFPFTVSMATNISGLPSFTGSFTGFTLDAKSMLVITASSSDTAVLGWGQVSSSAPVTLNTAVDLRDASTGRLLSRIGVAPSPTDMRRFVVPRLSNEMTSPRGFISATVPTDETNLVVINTGNSWGVLTGTLVSARGTVMATNTITVGPHMRHGIIPSVFFVVSQQPGTLNTYMRFESFSAEWATTALSAEDMVFASTVVDEVQ